MKHPLSTTAFLVFLFVCAQVIGIAIVSKATPDVTYTESGEPTLDYAPTAIGERPQFQGAQSFAYLLIGVGVGTALLLILMRFRRVRLWKLWYFVAVAMSLGVAFGVYIPTLPALALGAALALYKVYRPNPIVHNLTELFMYAGIAVLLVPLFDVLWVSLLLVAISIYDIIAVWQTKHMVAMATFQTDQRLSAGLAVPKKAAPSTPTRAHASESHARKAPGADGVAILGGGDIAFPLLFSGVVLKELMLEGVTRTGALYLSLIVTLFVTAGLAGLFFVSKKGRFYPAMPAVAAGCFVGLALIRLLA